MEKIIFKSNELFVFNTPNQNISIEEEKNQNIKIENKGDIIYSGEPFLGEYSTTPKIEKQIIPTKNKLLIKDYEVEAIPFYEVDNMYNGKTIIIGGN